MNVMLRFERGIIFSLLSPRKRHNLYSQFLPCTAVNLVAIPLYRKVDPNSLADFTPWGAQPAVQEIIQHNPHLQGRPFQILKWASFVSQPWQRTPLT